MRVRSKIILLVFFTAYLFIVLFTKFSLIGFWTDIIFSIGLSLVSLWIVFRSKTAKHWLTILLRPVAILLFIIVFGLITWSFRFIGTLDYFKLRSFYHQNIDGHVFNAYFKPVGAYAGGYGNFWITETPRYFPVIEKQVYYERAVQWDFSADSSDGKRVEDVVRSYIQDEVIDQKNNRR
jgi:hypothetical protein